MGAAAIFLLVVIAVIGFLAFGGFAALRSWLWAKETDPKATDQPRERPKHYDTTTDEPRL
jgi:hypothetical protein